MLALDSYRPDQWHDFFIMVGGAGAVLTGLVFVALSLDLQTLVGDSTHRNRAIGTLTNFAAIFVVCALVLMGGQDHIAIGVEWMIVATAAGVVYVRGYLHAQKAGGSHMTLSVTRTIIGTTLFVAQVAGAFALALGAEAGLYVAAVALVLLAAYSVTGAWLLLAGVKQEPGPSN